MNLAKVLQHEIAPSNAPWITNSCPADITRFIHEIILDEESDSVFNDSKVSSHFELYLKAMNQIGAAETSPDKHSVEIYLNTSHCHEFMNDYSPHYVVYKKTTALGSRCRMF